MNSILEFSEFFKKLKKLKKLNYLILGSLIVLIKLIATVQKIFIFTNKFSPTLAYCMLGASFS